jgi:hypothetical protein
VVDDIEGSDGVERLVEIDLHQIAMKQSGVRNVAPSPCDLCGGHVDARGLVTFGNGHRSRYAVAAPDVKHTRAFVE